VVAYHPDWEQDQWIATLKQSGKEWAKELNYDEGLANSVIEWLKDVRRFTPADLGLDWLMKLVARSEERYHDFAVDTMVRSFAPADFAPKAAPAVAPSPLPSPPGGEGRVRGAPQVDLAGASFCFTGKLATMGRKEAEGKVKAAGGVASSSVTKKLHYLVIGDEGSPLLGQGKKSDKHTKAEELNEAGANIQIISETSFLRMLSGEKREYSEDAALAGADRLWERAIAPG